MATQASALPEIADDRRFFLMSAIVMTLIVIAGFSLQLTMGRSSFGAPLLVHAHAVIFMGWVALNLAQNVFAATGSMALHRRLGWIGAGWIVLMMIFGTAVTVAVVRRGQVPFFFLPQQFLILDPLSVYFFAGLSAAAIAMRRRSDWHRRLHFCAMAILLGPAFGRLLPMPLLIPWAFEATIVPIILFPIAGMMADVRRTGSVHRAWWWGSGTIVASLLLINLITYSPVGDVIYRAAAAGSPGAAVSPLAYPPPPGGPLITGRSTSI